MRKTILMFALLILFTNVLHAADKNVVFATVQKQFAESEAVFMECENLEQNIRATLRATSTGKYKIITTARIVFCDGKSIWNYSPYQRRLVISDYEPSGTVSLENIFFALGTDYRAKSLQKQSTSSDGTIYKLVITPKNKESEYPDVTLWLDRSKTKLIKVFYDSDLFGKETWRITKINYYEKDTSNYEFDPPRKTQVIDLR